MKEESWALDYNFQNYNYRDNQRGYEGMSLEDGLRSLKVKLDFITLKIQLDTITNMFECKRNVNPFNSNHMSCDLCEGYHVTHTYMQAQNMDYFDEFEHFNPYFDQ